MTRHNQSEIPLEDLTDIAPDGDIILLIGPAGVRLRVHSIILKSASKVFKAMLGPHFSEGQPVEAGDNEVKEIPLPEDDVDAMKILCAVIHHRNNEIPENISADCIYKISVAADKYDFIVALSHASAIWLDPAGVAELEPLNALMAASYLFDNAQRFESITLKMIRNFTVSYLPLARGQQEMRVPWQIFYLLEERRRVMRETLQRILNPDWCAPFSDCTCGFNSKKLTACTHALSDNLLLPFQREYYTFSISVLFTKVENMGHPNLANSQPTCHGMHSQDNMSKRVLRGLRRLKCMGGICLDCLRNGTYEGEYVVNSNCRIKH